MVCLCISVVNALLRKVLSISFRRQNEVLILFFLVKLAHCGVKMTQFGIKQAQYSVKLKLTFFLWYN